MCIRDRYESIEAKPVPDAIVKCLTFTAIVSFEPIDNVLPVFNFNEASPYLFPVWPLSISNSLVTSVMVPLAIEFATAFDPCAIAEDALCTDTLLWTSGNPKHQGPDVVAALLFVCINTCDVLYAFTIPGELVSFTLCNKLKSKAVSYTHLRAHET